MLSKQFEYTNLEFRSEVGFEMKMSKLQEIESIWSHVLVWDQLGSGCRSRWEEYEDRALRPADIAYSDTKEKEKEQPQELILWVESSGWHPVSKWNPWIKVTALTVHSF